MEEGTCLTKIPESVATTVINVYSEEKKKFSVEPSQRGPLVKQSLREVVNFTFDLIFFKILNL